MAAARGRAVSTLRAALRPSSNGAARSQVSRMTQAGQRRWQSGHGSEHASSSDIPWLVGAVVVSVPGSYYLWPSAHQADAGHHGAHGEEHHEEGEETQDTEDSKAESKDDSGKDEKSDDSEQKQDDKKDDESEKKGSKDDDSQKKESKDDGTDKKEESKDEDKDDSKKSDQDGDDSGKDAGGDKSKGSKYASNPAGKDAPQFKGKMKEDAEGQSDTRKSEPQASSKGTNKKRIDSGAQKDLGSDEQVGEGATAKSEDGGKNDISSKQKGLSNTDTRHSTQIDQDDNKSKKSEGTPETAKNKGTVDSDRPAK